MVKVADLLKAIEEREKPVVKLIRFYTTESSMPVEVGEYKVHLMRNEDGTMRIQLETATPGFSISYEDGQFLADEIAWNKVVGRVGRYEWRLEEEISSVG